jgi:hypothetical protein
MSTSGSPAIRHPLGLPRGSIRGIMALMITLLFWLMIALPDSYKFPIPLSHYFLLALVMLFFVGHRLPEERSRDDRNEFPFYITVLRILIVIGTGLVIGYHYVNNEERLLARLTPSEDQVKMWPYYFMVTLVGFSLGYAFKVVPGKNSWVIQSFQAWICILAVFSLAAEILIQVFINPSLAEKVDLNTWQQIVLGLVAFYFGSRS